MKITEFSKKLAGTPFYEDDFPSCTNNLALTTLLQNALNLHGIRTNKLVYPYWLSIKKSSISEIWPKIKELIKSFGMQNVNQIDWVISKVLNEKNEIASQTECFVSEESVLILTAEEHHEANVELRTTNPEFIKKLNELCYPHRYVPEETGYVHALMIEGNSISFQPIGTQKSELERGNYSEDVLAGFDRIKEQLPLPTPKGRLSILSGPPGSGKTFMVRNLISSTKGVNFILVSADQVTQLLGPSFLPALIDFKAENPKKKIVLLIEDADECLAPRTAYNISSISSILNMGDGIIGSVLDLRVVATTNAEHQEIDPAIKRPGRLNAIVEVGRIDKEQSFKILSRLLERELTEDEWDTILESKSEWKKVGATLAELYQTAYDDSWKSIKVEVKKKMGFGA